MAWTGPFKFRDYLEAASIKAQAVEFPRPPKSSGVYLVSPVTWEHVPSEAFYVGNSTNLRERIGYFVFWMLGFEARVRHYGGEKLRVECQTFDRNPLDYYIAWRTDGCRECFEAELVEVLKPKANQPQPKRCGSCDPADVANHLGFATPY